MCASNGLQLQNGRLTIEFDKFQKHHVQKLAVLVDVVDACSEWIQRGKVKRMKT